MKGDVVGWWLWTMLCFSSKPREWTETDPQIQYSTIINILNRLHGGEVSKLNLIQLTFFQISGLDTMYECLPGHCNIKNSFVGQFDYKKAKS